MSGKLTYHVPTIAIVTCIGLTACGTSSPSSANKGTTTPVVSLSGTPSQTPSSIEHALLGRWKVTKFSYQDGVAAWATPNFALVEVFLYDTLSLILVYGRQRTRLAPLMAAGAVWQSEFMPDRFLVFAPQEHVALRYSDITTLDAVGDWSLLYLKGRRKVAVLPGSLVPEQEVERNRGHATGGN